MNSDVAIDVVAVSKRYRIWKQPKSRLTVPLARKTARSPLLPGFARNALARHVAHGCREFFALKHVDMRISKGESVGIIGHNGSGKSTLLQIIAGILQPTEGKATVKGRVAALLELGSGFNPEFSGRENVFLNASVLGLNRAQIEERFDDIASFADIGDFIEQPVKTYSSGMMVRLAFAVQTAVNPDILIVDEALSVGDQTFQRKCFARMEQVREQGTTILFVSHAMGMVLDLCQRAYFLHHGEVILEGKPKVVVNQYQRFCHAPADKAGEVLSSILEGRFSSGNSERQDKNAVDSDAASSGKGENKQESGSSDNENIEADEDPALYYDPKLVPESTMHYDSAGAEIFDVEIVNEKGHKVNLLKRKHFYYYQYKVSFRDACENINFAMLIKTMNGVELGGARTAPPARGIDRIEPGTSFKVRFRFQCLLLPGCYFLNAGVEGFVDEKPSYVHRLIDAYAIRVLPMDDDLATVTIDFNITSEYAQHSIERSKPAADTMPSG